MIDINAKEASITTLVDKEMKVVFNRTNGVIAKVEALVATQHGSVPTELLTQTLTALKAAQTTTATN